MLRLYDSRVPNYSKLYFNLCKFNEFKDIDENTLYEINEIVERFRKRKENINTNLYITAINYLTDQYNGMKFNFDVKMAFLILCCDPYFVHFNSFLEMQIISADEIDSLDTLKEQNDAKVIRNRQLKELKKNVIEILGYYDHNLINIEFSFFKAFYSDKILYKNIKADMNNLIDVISLNYLFINKLTNDEVASIITSSDQYLNYLFENNCSINTILFNIFYQGKILKLDNNTQKLLFLIATIDRDCRACLCFDTLPKIYGKREIEDLLGFYNKNFIMAEKEYQKKLGGIL